MSTSRSSRSRRYSDRFATRSLSARITIFAGRSFLFLFRPRPTHHATPRFVGARVRDAAVRASAAVYAGWSAPPPWRHRSCRAVHHIGAAGPQQRCRHSTPARARRFVRRSSFVPPPMRRHGACSGCPYRARASRAGKRRAGAPSLLARLSQAPTIFSTKVSERPPDPGMVCKRGCYRWTGTP